MKPTKESFFEWLSTLSINRMNHLGDYYTHITKKPFQKQNSRATAAYMKWLKEYFYEDLPPFLPFYSWVQEFANQKQIQIYFYSDWFGEGFLWELKAQTKESPVMTNTGKEEGK